MKTFKISKKSNKVVTASNLVFDEITVSGDSLCLVTDKNNALDVVPGAYLRFDKSASGNSGQLVRVCERDVVVNSVIDGDDWKRYIYFGYPYIVDFTIASVLKISSGDTEEPYRYKIYLTEEHGMVPLNDDLSASFVPTDFETYFSGLSSAYTVYAVRGDNIVYFTGIELCYPSLYDRGENIFGPDGECCPEDDTYFNYDTMERNSILATTFGAYTGNTFFPEPGDKLRFCTNQYFFTDASGIVHTYENVSVSKYTDFMGLNVVLEEDYDAKRMYQEYQVNELFVNKIKDSIIPGFIDLEKIKYAPAYSADSVYLATGLTFNLHFRTREMDKKEMYKFDPTWHLNELVDTWNNNGINSTPVKRSELYSDSGFVNSSNLIGYLDFTDDDIYNQKNRVKQSFLRLSFYDTNNPLTQSLLYYSTIFLDSGDLFGKFVRRKAWLQEMDSDYDEAENPVVWSPASSTDPVPAVTSQLIVNDEYDMTRSGEGFNLYLFRQDAPIENYPEDIYMKVEFNHAGNGRTIPLIFWKKESSDSTEPIKLSIRNYFDNLYIKVRIALTDKGYVYTFPDIDGNGIVWNDDRLVLNLFEPKLELEGEQIPEPTTVRTEVTGQFTQEPNTTQNNGLY